MSLPVLRGSTVLEFTVFCRELSAETNIIGTSVSRLESVYSDVSRAMHSIPSTIDSDNVVRQGLMENMLRRDTLVLLEALKRLRTTLVKPVRLLIQVGHNALELGRQISPTNPSEDCEYQKARSDLAKTIRALKILRSRLHLLDVE